MAKKKKQQRRRRTLSSGAPRRRRRSRRGMSSGISALMNPTALLDGVKKTFAAEAGGLAAAVFNKMVMPPTSGKMGRAVAGFGVGLLATMFNMPNVGAGFSGGMSALAFQGGLLADDNVFAQDNALMDGPIFLDENENPMVLEEGPDGAQYRYLTDAEIETLEEAEFAEYEEV